MDKRSHDFAYGVTDSPEDLGDRLKYLPPVYELRAKWSYNNQVGILVLQTSNEYYLKRYVNRCTL